MAHGGNANKSTHPAGLVENARPPEMTRHFSHLIEVRRPRLLYVSFDPIPQVTVGIARFKQLVPVARKVRGQRVFHILRGGPIINGRSNAVELQCT